MFLNPIIFNVGPFSIHWYSLAYILGITFTYYYLHKLDNKKIFTKNFYNSLLTTTIMGILLGGRFGYILIYDPVFYINNPIEILKTWNGGMSFHGGAIGVLFAVIISCRKHNIPIFYTLDLISCGAPIGLFLGRIGNFINGELFGRITTMPWGMVFPESGDASLRHPSQLYEAFFEGVLLFIIINLLFLFNKRRLYYGTTTGITAILYGTARFITEFFREPDYQIGYLWFNLTMGQLLSIPMILVGIFTYLGTSSNFNASNIESPSLDKNKLN